MHFKIKRVPFRGTEQKTAFSEIAYSTFRNVEWNEQANADDNNIADIHTGSTVLLTLSLVYTQTLQQIHTVFPCLEKYYTHYEMPMRHSVLALCL